MIKDKKGVISVSVIYSFFLLFCLLLILIMTTYTNNRVNFKLLKNDIKKMFVRTKKTETTPLISLIGSYSYTNYSDDLGDSGAKYLNNGTNNFISFGIIKTGANAGKNMIWRIIRVNGDGTIRLIYAGDIGSSKFNSNYDDAVYTGYMYSESVRSGLSKDSDVKNYIDSWYKDNLSNTKYEEFIAPSIFCVNRNSYTTPLRTSSAYGFGSDLQYFEDFNKTYTDFKCDSVPDRFDTRINYETVSGLNGNGALTYMVGLLTAAEAMKINISVKGSGETWTLSPAYFNRKAYTYYTSGGSTNPTDVDSLKKVRPVISIKADTQMVKKTDSNYGTEANPFVLATNQADFDAGTGSVCGL